MKIFVTDKYRILTFMLICAVMVTGAVFAGQGTEITSAVPKEIPIYSVQRDDNSVSVTFDCAWGAEDMESILGTLSKHNCKATFFVLGTWAEKNPDIMKKIVSEGHEVGNHSYNHKLYTGMLREEMLSDIQKCNEAIKNTCNVLPSLFRAPSGDYNNSVTEACRDGGMEYIQWSVDSLDWKQTATAESICERVVSKVENGSIVLFHNDADHTPEALPNILKCLLDEGYEFVFINDLILKDNYTIDHTGKQCKIKE